MSTETVTRRFASVNAVESKKRGLIRDLARRALLVLRWAGAEGVSVLCTQESGTMLAAAARRSRNTRPEKPGAGRLRRRPVGWGRFYAPPSTIVAGGKRERGNGVLWRRRDWRLVATAVESVPWRDSVTGKLHVPVVVLEDRDTGIQVAVASLHAPTRRADPQGDTRRALNAVLVHLGRTALVRDVPLVVGADSNDGQWLRDLQGSGLEVAAKHGVDHLLATRGVKATRDAQHAMPGLSDHHAVSACLTITG